jgi:hypothetical protein
MPMSGSDFGRRTTCLLGLALLSWGDLASAQSSPNAVIAEQLFRDGERLFASGSTHEACEKFAASNKLDPAPGTLNNLAICHEREGKTASAWLEQNELAGLAAQSGKKDRERAARDRAATLERALARVRLRAPDGAVVVALDVDGVSVNVAALGAPFPIDPGTHSFHVADSKGHQASVTTNVPAGPGTTEVAIIFAVEPPPMVTISTPPRESTPPDTIRPPDPRRAAGWILIGAGAGGVVAGGVLGALAETHRNDKPNNDAFAFATASDVAVGVGLAAAAGGALLVVLVRHAASHTTAWPVSPLVSPGRAALRLGGTF